MTLHFSPRSTTNLDTCVEPLRLLFREVIKHMDCTVVCGHRDEAAQEEAFRTGRSKARWGESLHNSFPSLAVDVVPYPIDWEDITRFEHFAGFVLGVATQMGISIEWGGRWTSIVDRPHFQMRQ